MPKYYDNIIDLPLSKYIEVAVKGNIYALVIEADPAPTADELTKAWNIIQQEYADAIGDGEVKTYVNLLRDTKLLEIKWKTVETCVNFLHKMYVPELADDVNDKLRQSFKFDYKNPEKYKAELKRCTNINKGIKLRWQIKMMELKSMQDKNNNPLEKPTEEYYRNWLITISDNAGYRLDDSLTTYEFCERVRRYTKSITV